MPLIAELMVLPVPVSTPKSAFAAETGWMAHRMGEFEKSRANAGVDLERVSLLSTPIGHITISYLEGTRGYRDVARTIRETPSVFDQDMTTRGEVLHGLSPEQQKQKRAPLDTAVLHREVQSPRQAWHAFAALIAPGRTEQWDAFCATLDGERRAEFDAFAAGAGFSVVCIGRYHGAGGDLTCMYLEGTDDTAALPKAVSRDGGFESWFAAEFAEIHGADLRDGLPSPAVGKPWDWVAGEPNEVPAPIFAQATALLGE